MPTYQEILKLYQNQPGGLLEAYHAIQKEYGCLPEEAICAAAEAFKTSAARAYGVAAFYSHFRIEKKARYTIRVCVSPPCHIAGAENTLAALEEKLGIKSGEVTSDGRFALEPCACVGQCQKSPVITINGTPLTAPDPQDLSQILSLHAEEES